MRAAVLLAGALALGIMSNAVGEVIYKWVDGEGVTHFSEIPPIGVDAERTTIKTRHTNRQTVQARNNTEAAQNAAVNTRRQQEKEQAADEKSDAAKNQQIRSENCARAKERLTTYNTARRLYRPLENGERDYLTDEELDNERAGAEKLVGEWCD